MRRGKAAKRGRWFWIVVAGFIGFLIGDRHAATWQPTWQATWQSADASAAQNIALRFPEPQNDGSAADVAADAGAAADTPTGSINAASLSQAQLALLNPRPMVPSPAPRAYAPATDPRAAQPAASAAPKAALAPRPHPDVKPAAETAASHANRPGFLLNDAQIASIKRRLHLTPDQENMWPAVEAALRDVAYARARAARRQGAPVNAGELAADPESAEVQGLKSAAIPLLMSFSEQQKNEVRSLAHVMGLDKLAVEF